MKPWGLRLAKFRLWGNRANDAGLGLSPLFLFLFVIFSIFWPSMGTLNPHVLAPTEDSAQPSLHPPEGLRQLIILSEAPVVSLRSPHHGWSDVVLCGVMSVMPSSLDFKLPEGRPRLSDLPRRLE